MLRSSLRTPCLRTFAAAAAAALAALVASEPDAEACSLAPCAPSTVLPPSSTTIPANAHGILAYGASSRPITLTKQTVAGTEAVAFSLSNDVVTPTNGFEPAATYEISVDDHESCGEGSLATSTFSTTASAPIPTSLGILKITRSDKGALTVGHGAACSAEVDAARVGVEVQLSADAAPWANLFVWETLVDGKRWQPSANIGARRPVGESWQGRGKDLVFEACGTSDLAGVDEGVTAGTHSVVMRATLPTESNAAFETSPIQIEVDCTSMNNTVDKVVPPSASAGEQDNASPTGSNSAWVPSTSDGACSVSTVPGSALGGSRWLIALGLGVAAVVVRGRDRARRVR